MDELSEEQWWAFDTTGFLLLPGALAPAEVRCLQRFGAAWSGLEQPSSRAAGLSCSKIRGRSRAASPPPPRAGSSTRYHLGGRHSLGGFREFI
jgi:hypothetical protein